MSTSPIRNGNAADGSPARPITGFSQALKGESGVILGHNRKGVLAANRQRQLDAAKKNAESNMNGSESGIDETTPPLTPMPPRRPPGTASAPSSSCGGDELVLLKKKLAKQKDRLHSATTTPQRGTAVAQTGYTSPQSLRGHQYTKTPYTSIPNRIMWEPFSDDPEVKELNEKGTRCEDKIQRLVTKMEHNSRCRRKDASIKPPDPKVFSARDEEVLHLAAEAESYAETGHLKYCGSAFDSIPVMHVEDDGSPSPREQSITGRPEMSASRLTTEGLVRRSSSVHVDKHTIGLINALKMPAIDIELPSPTDVDFDRNGDVLGRKCILKADLFDGLFTRRDKIGVMSGAPYFRMIPKFNIGGVAQASISGFQTCVNEIFKVYSGTLVWVNLREEALSYINGRSFCIRSEINPTEPHRIPGITGERITEMEEKLCREVLAESDQHGGNICVHKESATGKVHLSWEAVDTTCVTTMKDAMNNLRRDANCQIEYVRLPIAFEGIRVSQFDEIIELCRKFPSNPVMLNCQTGRGKSTSAMIIFAIVRFYQHCTPADVKMDVSMMRGDGKSSNFRTIMKLITLLHDGVKHERRVAMICELAGDLSNLRERIASSFREDASMKAMCLLRTYAYIVTFSCYCEALFWGTGGGNTTVCRSFGQFLNEMDDVKLLIEDIMRGHREMADRAPTPTPEQEPVSPEEKDFKNEVRNRHGNVLSSGMILRSYPTELAARSAIPGVTAFRQLCTDVPYFTCGRNTEAGMEDMIHTIRQNFPRVKEIHWVNVRAEPSVYINSDPYVMLDGTGFSDEELASLHISGDRIEEIEKRLKADVIKEAEQNRGNILVHKMTGSSKTSTPQRVQVRRVQTPRIAKESCTSDVNLVYHRLPVPATDKIRLSDFNPIVALFSNFSPDSAVILTDSGGGMRTTLCLNLLTMVRVSLKANLRSIRQKKDIHDALEAVSTVVEESDPPRSPVNLSSAVGGNSGFYGGMDEKEVSTLSGDTIELHLGSQLSQMMTAGHVFKALGHVVQIGGRGVRWNVLEAMDIHKRTAERETGAAKKMNTFKALCSAHAYLYLLVTAIYVSDVAPEFGETLDSWVDRHPEIENFFEKFIQKEALMLKYVVSSLPAKYSVENRHGMVLATNFGIKADHFPGCQRKGMVPAISGAPNFRKVPHLNIFGVAIPTVKGIRNVLNVLGASDHGFYQYTSDPVEDSLHLVYPHNKVYGREKAAQEKPLRGRVLWLNLREEPIMYVSDRPMVFRDLTNPYVNVELTGIEASKVEHVEEMLREDVLAEAAEYNGQFMVHDEGAPLELVGYWEGVDETCVRTISSVYQSYADEGDRVTFVRLPVTDETEPETKDFDKMINVLLPEILENMSHGSQPLSMVFNCQMGRGRTTTGMVIGAMLIGVTYPEYYAQLEEDYEMGLWNDSANEFAQGNYLCITQLKGILRDGSDAKRRLDLVLEACNRMQNLRAAIETWKIMLDNPDCSDSDRVRAHHHGILYLQRYFTMICFSSYLHAEYDRKTRTLGTTFAQWMADRDELRHIHDSVAVSGLR